MIPYWIYHSAAALFFTQYYALESFSRWYIDLPYSLLTTAWHCTAQMQPGLCSRPPGEEHAGCFQSFAVVNVLIHVSL